MTETKNIGEPSLWIPITDKPTLAALGKLAEEVNELGAIIARTIIQGLDGVDPETKEVNIDALRDEIADVRGLSRLVIERLDFAWIAIHSRALRKYEMKKKWIRMLENE